MIPTQRQPDQGAQSRGILTSTIQLQELFRLDASVDTRDYHGVQGSTSSSDFFQSWWSSVACCNVGSGTRLQLIRLPVIGIIDILIPLE